MRASCGSRQAFSYRKNWFLFRPPEINDDISATEYPIGVFASNDSGGETQVAEIYGEFLVPITGGLDLELGYWYSDFDSADGETATRAPITSGGNDTWKALFTWSPTQSRPPRRIPVRDTDAEYGRAIYGPDGRYSGVRAERPVLVLHVRALGQRAHEIRGASKSKSFAGRSYTTAPRRSTAGQGGPYAFALGKEARSSRSKMPRCKVTRVSDPRRRKTWTFGVVLERARQFRESRDVG